MQTLRADRRHIAAVSPSVTGYALAALRVIPFTFATASIFACQINGGTLFALRTDKVATTSGLERAHALAR